MFPVGWTVAAIGNGLDAVGAGLLLKPTGATGGIDGSFGAWPVELGIRIWFVNPVGG